MTTPIPQPPAVPLLGNINTVEDELPVRSYLLLAKQYGEVYQLNILGHSTVMANSYELQNELSDEKRFKKVVAGPLKEVRRAAGDGLFTADLESENWGIAHRILMPAFGPAAVTNMYSDMMDIASQLVLKWERFGPNHAFEVSEDFTRLAFDTISLCAMGYRINSFYTPNMPEFVQAMVDFLSECYARPLRLFGAFRTGINAKFEADADKMMRLCAEIVAERKKSGDGRNDLLDRMLNGRDPKTGQGLSDENIMYQLLTFMIAGHETTSGALSFVTHCLLTNPDAYLKLQAEVDSVIGERTVTLADIGKMPYMTAVIREALRLFPTASGRGVAPVEDTTICNGKYTVKKGQAIRLVTIAAQRDPKLWGEDAEKFRPERLLGENFDQLPSNAWQPFGFGVRACIGRPFAWQEMHLVLSCIIQKFDLQLADPSSYTLHVKSSLTIKPHVRVRAIPRAGRQVQMVLPAPSSSLRETRDGLAPREGMTQDTSKQRMYVLYGSNTGSCESFAQKIATAAPSHGFSAKLFSMDAATATLPTDGPVIIISASYEGEPPDNAGKFVSWLRGLKATELEGVKFSVFGAGNHDWVATYQRIPKLCDTILEERGAQRLLARGEGDAGGAEFFQAFDTYETQLWETLAHEYSTTKSEARGIQMKLVDPGTARASALRQADVSLGTVVENRLLSHGGPEKRHIEFDLPENTLYQAGDYLAILPTNPEPSVRRVLARFNISSEQEIVLSAGDGPTSLPVDKPINVHALLSGYVELSQPASSGDLRALLEHAPEATKPALEALLASHAELVMSVRLSVLDVLDRHKEIAIPFPAYLQLLPSMRVRQYSISSSPLHDARRASLTVSVLHAPALADAEQAFLGVGSSYLAGLRAGDRVTLSVRPSNASFHLPANPAVPVAMFAAGSGLAPMRGFIQERAEQRKAGRETGRMVLFYGCRTPEDDYLYSDSDLKEWEALGVVEVRPAFSRKSVASQGAKYVQDRVLLEKTDISEVYKSDGKFYVCGSSKLSIGVKGALTEVIRMARNCTSEEAGATFDEICKGRFATDIFE